MQSSWKPQLQHLNAAFLVWNNGSCSNYSRWDNETQTVLWSIQISLKRRRWKRQRRRNLKTCVFFPTTYDGKEKEKTHNTFTGCVIWDKQTPRGERRTPSFCALHTIAIVFFIQHALCGFSSSLKCSKGRSIAWVIQREGVIEPERRWQSNNTA